MNNYKLLLLLIFMVSCSDLFNTDNESIKPLTINGTIELDDLKDAENVFVYLNKFDLSTMTDSLGNFELRIPPPGQQEERAGYNGTVIIYYFKENYISESMDIEFASGIIMTGQDEIDIEGTLYIPQVLEKAFSIKILANKFQNNDGIIDLNLNEILEIDIIKNTYDKGLKYYEYVLNNFWPETGFSRTGLYLMDKNNINNYYFLGKKESYIQDRYINSFKIDTTLIFLTIEYSNESNEIFLLQLSNGTKVELARINVLPGDYFVYPFFRMNHSELPEYVLDKLYPDLSNYEFDKSYFQLKQELEPLLIRVPVISQ